MSADTLVLGGGFAGLSCAAALAERGARVLVAEKKSHLGGRAYSFKDPETGASVDNGQHLFMGCYRHTRRFLERIGRADRLSFGDRVRIDFVDSTGSRARLSLPRVLGAPWNFAAGVWGLKGLTLRDRLGLRRLHRELSRLRRGGISPWHDTVTVRQWLDSLDQSRRIQERLFDPIALGALNEDPAVAAATGLAQVLLEIFWGDREGARFGLAAVGLSELYTDAARDYIESRGGRVRLGAGAESLIESDGRVRGVRLRDGGELRAEHVVSTLAPWDLAKLRLPRALRGPWQSLSGAPIVSLCLWLDRPVVTEPIVGLLGTTIQWAFNKSRIFRDQDGGGQYLALVISGARGPVGLKPSELLAAARRDLTRCFPEFKKAKIRHWRVVKEPFATISPSPGTEAVRPAPGTGMPGFYFAGDWTRTGLPATIESAVASAHRVAGMIAAG